MNKWQHKQALAKRFYWCNECKEPLGRNNRISEQTYLDQQFEFNHFCSKDCRNKFREKEELADMEMQDFDRRCSEAVAKV